MGRARAFRLVSMAVVARQQGLVARVANEPTDRPDTLPPSFWPTHHSNLGSDPPTDLFAKGDGDPRKKSDHYFYPDAVFSDTISIAKREWLRACWTDVDKVRELLNSGTDVHQT